MSQKGTTAFQRNFNLKLTRFLSQFNVTILQKAIGPWAGHWTQAGWGRMVTAKWCIIVNTVSGLHRYCSFLLGH